MDGYKQREDAASSANSKRIFRIEIKRAELTKETSIKDGIYIIKIKPHERFGIDEERIRDSENRLINAGVGPYQLCKIAQNCFKKILIK